MTRLETQQQQPHEQSIVVWHECRACGDHWPFPYGDAPASGRDWTCPRCLHADTSRAVRQLRDVPRHSLREGFGLLPDPTGRWLKADDVDRVVDTLCR